MKIADLDFDSRDKEKSSPKDRVPMIKEAFKLVLNREPSSRELSFYKYGMQSKEEITEKLLNDDEHKEAFEKAKQLPEIEEQKKQAEHKVMQLTQNMEDSQEEIVQVKNLLEEKNKEIAILRREKGDPYNFTHADALKYIKQLTQNDQTVNDTSTQESFSDTHFSSISASNIEKEKTFLDKFYDFIKSI
jgi:hypothetical protein